MTDATDAQARPRTFIKVAAGLLLAAAASVLALFAFDPGGVSLPARSAVKIARLDQGWAEAQARDYHHRTQGTKILPLDWFMALERPSLNPLQIDLLADRAYLARFGFLYDDDAPTEGKRDLPIGFAVDEAFVAPYARPPVERPTAVVGLTCAACHTGRIDVPDGSGGYRGVLIEGGSAMINLSKFQEAVGRSLYFTLDSQGRFRRFARKVLGDGASADARDALRREVKAYVDAGIAGQDYAKDHKLFPVDAGFARTDALGLIGNRVFGVADVENQAVTDAPVNFPHLWDTAWFDWVQYNASIRTPMVRNIGEALGVGASVDLTPGGRFASTVRVDNLAWMEDLLGGDAPMQGLQPPSWEAMARRIGKWTEDRKALGPWRIDGPKRDEGERLYRAKCMGCHLPPRVELARGAETDRGVNSHWTSLPIDEGHRFLKVPAHDLSVIGTDPNQALNFHRRVAVTPRPGQTETISAEAGLFRVTSFIRRENYLELLLLGRGPDGAVIPNPDPAKAAERVRYDRGRGLPPSIVVGDEAAVLRGDAIREVIVANLGYKARPLDGIWATPPFLHNGSVPNLEQLLRPAAERSRTFHLGTTRYDPVRVGYEAEGFSGSFELDTRLPGNSNSGHEYRNLTLEEFEKLHNHPWNGVDDPDTRWAYAVGLPDAASWVKLDRDQRRALARTASAKALPAAGPTGIRGLLGVDLTDAERSQLLEYLKTL